MPNNVTTENITKSDIIDNIKKVENLTKDLKETNNKLNETIKFLNDIGTIIGDRIKIYMDTLNNKDLNENSKNSLVEPKEIENNQVEEIKQEEKKLNISKFIETFSQEFDFIKEDEFNEEMGNDEIMNKIIELIKRMLGIKDNEINEKKREIDGLKIKKSQLEDDIKTLNSNITEKENKNHILESKKIELEENIRNLNLEVKNLKTELEENIGKLNKKKKELEEDLKKEKDEVEKLENKKKELNRKNEEKDKKLEKFMKLFEDKEKELISIGDLLQARKLYDKYLSMEARILSKLENVLIQRDFESFISSGYTLSSLDNVWDIVKIEYKNISRENRETLKEVFAFFLNQINKRFKDAKYGLVEAEVGEDFDAVNQVDLSQNSRGKVTECVFYGYGFLNERENPNDEATVGRIIKSPLVLTI